jgi:hypothetical protein
MWALSSAAERQATPAEQMPAGGAPEQHLLAEGERQVQLANGQRKKAKQLRQLNSGTGVISVLALSIPQRTPVGSAWRQSGAGTGSQPAAAAAGSAEADSGSQPAELATGSQPAPAAAGGAEAAMGSQPAATQAGGAAAVAPGSGAQQAPAEDAGSADARSAGQPDSTAATGGGDAGNASQQPPAAAAAAAAAADPVQADVASAGSGSQHQVQESLQHHTSNQQAPEQRPSTTPTLAQ